MSFKGIYRRLVDDDPNAGRSDAELETEADRWGLLARKSAEEGHDASAQFAREARAAAQAELRARGKS